MFSDKFYFLDSLNIGILILNNDRKIVFLNSWLKTRLKNSNYLTIGETLEVDEEKCKRFNDALSGAGNAGQSFFLTTRLNKSPIDLYHGKMNLSYNLCISRLTKNAHEKGNILIQFTDVTQVEEREKYLKEKQKEIDIQRSKSFYQERLASLGEMTSSIAHEINNPLAILEMNYKTFKKMLSKKGHLDDNFEEIFQEGHDVIKRISNLISSVRNLAHAPTEKDFCKEKVRSVLKSALVVFMEKARSSGIELKFNAKLDVFNVDIDMNRALLGQVFVNLLNNSFHAIQHLDEKWLEIDGEICGNELHISFTDSGPGIPESIQEKMFIPFYTTKDIGEGTGLGLSTILKIMRVHSGDINIDNESPNTRFLLKLPMKINSRTLDSHK